MPQLIQCRVPMHQAFSETGVGNYWHTISVNALNEKICELFSPVFTGPTQVFSIFARAAAINATAISDSLLLRNRCREFAQTANSFKKIHQE